MSAAFAGAKSAAGFAMGWIGGKLMQVTSEKSWTEETFQRLSAIPLAIIAFALAESVGDNGCISAFVAGLGLTAALTSEQVRHQVQEFGETEGTQLILVVFLIFGLAMVPAVASYWGLREFFYALASLTVLRMVPVAIALAGARLDWQTVAFIGWFGPRGIASVLYLLMAVAALGISVYAHGLSAIPLSEWYVHPL